MPQPKGHELQPTDYEHGVNPTAAQWCITHIDFCPRSPEWKHGARAGAFTAHGLPAAPSCWASGTVQDDARNAGFQYGYEQAKHAITEQLKDAAIAGIGCIFESNFPGACHE